MLEISPLEDVMSYFHLIFFTYIVLLIVIALNFIKALYINRKLNLNKSSGKSLQLADLSISVFCGLAMFTGHLFQGVLADNNALEWNTWNNRLLLISIMSLIIFILNLIVVFKNNKK